MDRKKQIGRYTQTQTEKKDTESEHKQVTTNTHQGILKGEVSLYH